MENMTMLASMIMKNDWLVTIDLKDAYLRLPVHKEHQKYLRFVWGKTLYQYRAMPFGLSSAPREFTKLLKPVMSILRRLGIRMLIYLDDIIILNQDPVSLIKDRDSTIWILQNLGFIISWEKSHLTPSQKVEYLGWLIDSQSMNLSLPEAKLQDLLTQCQLVITQNKVSARLLSRLIGKLNACVMAVLPAPLHYRQLQMQKARELLKANQNYGSRFKLSNASKDEIRWWLNHLKQWNGKSIITPSPDLIIDTDASKKGWGAVCKNVTTQGMWT